MKISHTCILAVVVLAFLFVRLLLIHPTFSDETLYFNVAKHVLNGAAPYKDFFFAHPPLQPYVLALVFKIFGTSFWIAKAVSTVFASLCVLLTYLISKELYKDQHSKKSSFLSALIIFTTPAFITFSTMGYGMWETLFLVLLSMYVLVKNGGGKGEDKKTELLAAIVFASAVFFRYLALLYLPFLILLLRARKIKFKRFGLLTTTIILVALGFCVLVFGQAYIQQTVYYHAFSKVVLEAPRGQKMQYLGIGFFSMFLALLSASVGYAEKDRVLLVLAITALATDLIILVGLKLIFYHYFIISLPFYSIAAGRAFTISKDRIVKAMIPIVIVLSIISNIQTIDFYLNPSYANRFYEAVGLVESGTLESDTIFGEPVLTNYISFVTDRKIAGGYLDSYKRHLLFEDVPQVIEDIKSDEPRFLIEMENYYMTDQNFKSLFDGYELEKEMPGTPNYYIYKK